MRRMNRDKQETLVIAAIRANPEQLTVFADSVKLQFIATLGAFEQI